MKYIVYFTLVVLALTAQMHEPAVHVLCYHAFRTAKDKYSFSLSDLEKHILYLKKAGYSFVSLQDVIHKKLPGRKNVLISIDDGNVTVYKAYYQVFKKYNIKPLLAIYPAIIGKQRYALSWKQLAELAGEGCEIAAHGYYHLMLKSSLYHSNPRAFRQEIILSKKILEKKIGIDVSVFVYPYGIKCAEAKHLLKNAGYQYAFTVEQGRLSQERVESGTYELPRHMLTKYTVSRHFRDMAYRDRFYRKDAHSEQNMQVGRMIASSSKPVNYKKVPGIIEKKKHKTIKYPGDKQLFFELTQNKLAASRLRHFERGEQSQRRFVANNPLPGEDDSAHSIGFVSGKKKYSAIEFINSEQKTIELKSLDSKFIDLVNKSKMVRFRDNMRQTYHKQIVTTSIWFKGCTNHMRERMKQKGRFLRQLYERLFSK